MVNEHMERIEKAYNIMREVSPKRLTITHSFLGAEIEAVLNHEDILHFVDVVRKQAIKEIKDNLK